MHKYTTSACIWNMILTKGIEQCYKLVYKLQRTMGLRFLYPVYLIDVVEVMLHDQTSDVTITRSKMALSYTCSSTVT